MDYLATFINRKITYEKSDMVLHVHSDGSYLVKPEAKNRAGGLFYLSNFINYVEIGTLKLNGTAHML